MNNKVVHRFLSMCTDVISSKMGILWRYCVDMSVDSTAVNTGPHNSISPREWEKRPGT